MASLACEASALSRSAAPSSVRAEEAPGITLLARNPAASPITAQTKIVYGSIAMVIAPTSIVQVTSTSIVPARYRPDRDEFSGARRPVFPGEFKRERRGIGIEAGVGP